MAKKLPVLDGMIGCIRKFMANEHDYGFSGQPFGDVTHGFDVRKLIFFLNIFSWIDMSRGLNLKIFVFIFTTLVIAT